MRPKFFLELGFEHLSAVFPDTEGIETINSVKTLVENRSAVFPDTEGIETVGSVLLTCGHCGLQFSLILKGLRHRLSHSSGRVHTSAVFPDTEGIETKTYSVRALWKKSAVFPDTEGIETRSVPTRLPMCLSAVFPDTEGIETQA